MECSISNVVLFGGGVRCVNNELSVISMVGGGGFDISNIAAMACFRGLADDLPLMQWLQEYIFPVEAKLTGDMVYRATLLSLAEMIKSGTTSFCDMYLFAKDVARAAQESGMRAWIGEGCS